MANVIMAVVLNEKHPARGLHIQWLYLILFGVASVIASWLLVKGIKLIEAGAAGVLGLLEIVFGLLFGIVFFRERPSAVALLGALVITAAAIPYVSHYNFKKGTIS